MITEFIIEKTGWPLLPEPTNENYSMFNTGGVESEVGEFLYSLVILLKPDQILETGTYHGVSSTYMALALKNNNKGHITTIDYVYHDQAKYIHTKTDISSYITQLQMDVNNFSSNKKYQLILIDTEPILRFDEFIRFYDNVDDGGLIIIHDLHPNLSYNPVKNPNLPFMHWPYGDFRPKLGKFIKEYKVQTLSFNTPRGLTIFQKNKSDMSYINYLNNEI
jgi:hypothetical protein